MSTIKSGILGGFSGKVGNVVGAKWKGIDTMKIKPSNVTNPRTTGQLDQRTKFSTVLRFLQPMTDYLRVGFKLYSKGMSQFNSAMSYNLQNAITGSYPNYSIDYANALVSRGPLTGVVNGLAESKATGIVHLVWTNNSNNGNALSSDKALIVVLNPLRGEAICIKGGEDRLSEEAEVTVPLNYAGEDVCVFLGFMNAEGTKVSNSSYLGTINVAT